jgi:hypothetical protein
VQFTKRDWRNRNIIKTPQGPQWLTIPVISKGSYTQKINEVIVKNNEWPSDHWKAITLNYKRAKYFDEITDLLMPLYNDQQTFLSDINLNFIVQICKYLKIKTKISKSSEYKIEKGKTNRLSDLCLQANATEYISGPAAKDYIEKEYFDKSNIKLSFFDYNNYLDYPQLWGTFIHKVSIIDLLFNCGLDSCKYMKFAN